MFAWQEINLLMGNFRKVFPNEQVIKGHHPFLIFRFPIKMIMSLKLWVDFIEKINKFLLESCNLFFHSTKLTAFCTWRGGPHRGHMCQLGETDSGASQGVQGGFGAEPIPHRIEVHSGTSYRG